MAVGLRDVIGAGLCSAAVGFALTPLAGYLARRLSILDWPGGYKAHAAPTPLLGGLAIAAATAIAAVAFFPDQGDLSAALGLAVGAAVILAVGLVDDARALSAGRKFAWQIAAVVAAGAALAVSGIRLSLFLDWSLIPIGSLTILWILAVTNAVNFQDNMNGLCAGLGAVGAGALSAINLRSGELDVAIVAAALAGACVGFLPHNWPRARIFLGDGGSMLIGFLLAALSVMGVYTRRANVPEIAVFAPLLALAVPLLDLCIVVLLRLRLGRLPWLGDRRHVSHRLARRGLSPVIAVASLCAVAATAALGAVILPTLTLPRAALLVTLLLCLLGALAFLAGGRGLDD